MRDQLFLPIVPSTLNDNKMNSNDNYLTLFFIFGGNITGMSNY